MVASGLRNGIIAMEPAGMEDHATCFAQRQPGPAGRPNETTQTPRTKKARRGAHWRGPGQVGLVVCWKDQRRLATSPPHRLARHGAFARSGSFVSGARWSFPGCSSRVVVFAARERVAKHRLAQRNRTRRGSHNTELNNAIRSAQPILAPRHSHRRRATIHASRESRDGSAVHIH